MHQRRVEVKKLKSKPFFQRGLTIVVIGAMLGLAACVTTPTGETRLSPEGQVALETAAKIAVRHLVSDSPRGAEKAQNVRAIVVRLQNVLTADSTLGALKNEVSAEIEKLGLSDVDRMDAQDLLELFAAALEARLGPDALKSEGLVKVSEFLAIVVAALPPPGP